MKIKANMYLMDWICLVVWLLLFWTGVVTAYIMIPVVLVFGVLNYMKANTTMTLFRLDMNLMIANVTGIFFSSYLFAVFIHSDAWIMGYTAIELFAGIIYIIMIAVCSLMIKDHIYKENRRIIREMEEEKKERRHTGRSTDQKKAESDMYKEGMNNFETLMDDADDKITEQEDKENKGPKFRVIVKNKKS